MEWIDGGSLEDYSKNRASEATFDPDTVGSGFLAAIIPSIVHFWVKRTHHGDLKPNNIMVRDGNPFQPTVADFGESRLVLDGICMTERGTPPYRCPKMDGKHQYSGFLGDIHALGWVVVALIVGVAKYEGHILGGQGSKGEVWNWVKATNTSPQLLELLLRMTQEDPGMRPTLYEICTHPCVEAAKIRLGPHSAYQLDIVQDDLSVISEIGILSAEKHALATEIRALKDRLKVLEQRTTTTLGGDEDDGVPGIVSTVSTDTQEIASVNATTGTASADMQDGMGDESAVPFSWLEPFRTLPKPDVKSLPKLSNLENIDLPKDKNERDKLTENEVLVYLSLKIIATMAKKEEFTDPRPETGTSRLEYLIAHIMRLGYRFRLDVPINCKYVGDNFKGTVQKYDLKTRFPGGFVDAKDMMEKLTDAFLKSLYNKLKSFHKQGFVSSRVEMDAIVVSAFNDGFSSVVSDVPPVFWESAAKDIALRLWEIHSW